MTPTQIYSPASELHVVYDILSKLFAADLNDDNTPDASYVSLSPSLVLPVLVADL
jgi:hypothetical protein